MNPTQLPAEGTLALLVLQIIAVSGEFPPAFSGHFPGGSSYIGSVIGKLKKDGLLRSYTKNGLRGLRLTASAKRLLLQKYPFDLAPYLTGTSETNSLKSEPERRLRLHRMAEALQILHNAQIPSLPWEKPSMQDWLSNPTLFPVYYSSREFKSLGSLCTKIRNSRMTGVLFTEQAIFPVYNMASTFPRWAYNAEIRLKAVLQTEFCRNAQFAISGIVFGSSSMQIPAILNDMAQNHFLLDGSYPHFYFLTLDHFGVAYALVVVFLRGDERDYRQQYESRADEQKRVGRQICRQPVFVNELAALFDYRVCNQRSYDHRDEHEEENADSLKLTSRVLGIELLAPDRAALQEQHIAHAEQENADEKTEEVKQ